MRGARLLAWGAVSPQGVGRAAVSVGAPGARPDSRVRLDAELAARGFAKPWRAQCAAPLEEGCSRAESWLWRALRDAAVGLDAALPGWRLLRVAVLLGTSGGGLEAMVPALTALAEGRALTPSQAARAPYFGPLRIVSAALGMTPQRLTQVLGACASSTLALGHAALLLEAGSYDVVFAGGYDGQSEFIAAGFEALGATCAGVPAPFRVGRAGMALGEGAAVLALVRPELGGGGAATILRGHAAASEAVHITAPDRTGQGFERAAREALEDAALLAEQVELVGPHATSTPFNDAAEAAALTRLLGSRAAVAHPFKAVIGHCLGAAGALESLALVDALERGVLPAALGEGELEPAGGLRLLERNRAGRPEVALKLSAAFGGVVAALVFARHLGRGQPVPERAVGVVAVGQPVTAVDAEELASQVREGFAHARLDALSALAVAAVARLRRGGARWPERTGVLVASSSSTLEQDERFARRLRERGPRWAEPRRFVPTSPNVCAGQISIAFGLTALSHAVGAGPDAPLEALELGRELVARRRLDACLIVAAEEGGAVTRAIWSAAGWPAPEAGACAVLLGPLEVGPALTAERVAVARARCRAGAGRWRGAAPGWPVLLQAAEAWRPDPAARR